MPQTELFKWDCPDKIAFGGALSDDDELWFCPCSLEHVRSLILNPRQWIKCLNDKTGARVVLSNHFVMKISLVDRPNGSPAQPQIEPPSQFIVQGISGTGVLTIRPGQQLAQLVEPWDAYWQRWASEDEAFAVGRGSEHSVGYAHLQLSDPNDSRDVRADKIAAFLMYGANPSRKINFNGEEMMYMNTLLRKKATALFELGVDGVAQLTPGTRQFRALTPVELAQVNFLFAGRLQDYTLDGDPPPPTPPPPACDNKAGTIGPDGLIRLDDVTVKDYVKDDPPPLS